MGRTMIHSLALTPRRRQTIRAIVVISIVSAVVSGIFTAVDAKLSGEGVSLAGSLAGAAVGATVAFCGASAEFFLFIRRLSRLPFLAVYALRLTLWCGMSVLGMRLVGIEVRYFGVALVFSVAMGSLFTFFVYLRRLVGGGTMIRFLTGRYNRPREEERIFLFADIIGSTAIAERIGNRLYHQFLNDVWFDLSDALAACAGEVYKYVGDEIIVTWAARRGARDARCLKLCAAIPRALAARESYYRKRYDAVPELKQGLHAGLVTIGEMGDTRMEIAYLGDVLNTASRLMSYAEVLRVPALISGDVVDRLPVLNELLLKRLGPVNLRGKERQIEVFALA